MTSFAKLVRLTPRGHETLREIQAAQRAWSNRVGARIGEAGLRHASRVVDQLSRVLVESSTGSSGNRN